MTCGAAALRNCIPLHGVPIVQRRLLPAVDGYHPGLASGRRTENELLHNKLKCIATARHYGRSVIEYLADGVMAVISLVTEATAETPVMVIDDCVLLNWGSGKAYELAASFIPAHCSSMA